MIDIQMLYIAIVIWENAAPLYSIIQHSYAFRPGGAW